MTDPYRLIDYLNQLSDTDPKTLSERHLKASEELGELASAILPYIGAAGTMHRFVTHNRIVEEIADSLLCLYSIARKIGASPEDLMTMVQRKAVKWQAIQTGEGALKDPRRVPFELHITVAPTHAAMDWSQSGLQYQDFVHFCAGIGTKFTVLDLYGIDQNKQDWMTSSTFVGTVEEVDAERARIVAALNAWRTKKNLPFEIVREKIETVPWHPAAPSLRGAVQFMPRGCYFEKHWEIPIAEADLARFSDFANREGLSASRNIRKPPRDGTILVSLTHRDSSHTREYFEGTVGQIEDTMKRAGYVVSDSISEFAIYDTAVDHDANWIKTFRTAE